MTGAEHIQLLPLDPRGLKHLHPQARRSIFWEIAAADEALIRDSALEKEAWIIHASTTLGACGFNLITPSETLGTIFFCPPVLARGISRLPTGPVPRRAMLLSSLFRTPHVGTAPVLIDAALMHLTQLGIDTVQAFGWRASGREKLDWVPERIGLMSEEELQAAGFEVVREHPVVPRLEITLPPDTGELAEAARKALSAELRC
ncbi:hypothetical protein CCICO_11490 [Corynebacterium ciconiae DSM 44920]|uniref:hypothetical protein n=1 Tax=Corynebacterium ciconiae TaxID=227319 RepID=UPI00035F1B3E|nr:hypothetical protein [Corynebacterium ciconiae]WKD62289.1 hypothetical protein CCICO_11490 [Corynebacterium ciconiae DSM 44920]